MLKPILLILAIVSPFLQANAEWKQETVGTLDTLWYMPKSTLTTKRALMINLHGCAQKADDLKKDGNWEATSDEYNMIVALPKVPNGGVYSGCWDYYGADHTLTNRHNGPIVQLVKALLARTDLNIDPGQVYISGLSSGGGEAMVMGCLAPDLFAGMGLNAGPSTGTSASEISYPQTSVDKMLSTCKALAGAKSDSFKTQLTSIIYGNNDYTVSTAFDTNNAQIMSTIYGAAQKSTFDTKKLDGAVTDGTGTLFSDSVGPRISLIMNTGLGHNWPAGQGGNGGNFINKKSINYPAYITKFFFENNRRSKNPAPSLSLSSVTADSTKFTLTGTLNIDVKNVKSIDVTVTDKKSNAVVDQFTMKIDGAGNVSGTSKNLADGQYSFAIKLNLVSGTSELFSREAWLGDVQGTMSPQLSDVTIQTTADCLSLNGRAVTNGGDKLTGVQIDLDGAALGNADVDSTSAWTFKSCGIATGTHQVSVYAENASQLKSSVQQFKFSVGLAEVTATLQQHMEAARLKWEDYGVWFAKYGSKPFTLYQWSDHTWKDTKEN